MRLLGKALTFDDVLLVPAFSQVLPRDTSLATRLSRNIPLNLPLVSRGNTWENAGTNRTSSKVSALPRRRMRKAPDAKRHYTEVTRLH